MSDRLSLTRAIEGAGLASAAAERIATEIYEAIHDNVASKADLRELEQRLELRFEKLEHEITRMTIRLAVVVVAAAGLAGTIVHFWR